MSKAIKLPIFLQHFPVPILKGPARGKWWTLYPYSAYWRQGGHEAEMDAAMQSVGDLRGKSAWDFGAHYGIYSLVLSCLVGNDGQVVSFEPDSVSFARLEKHMRMNRVQNAVIFNAAASDTCGESFIVLDSGAGGTTSHLLYWGEQLTDEHTTQRVECLRADELVAAGRIRLPDLIKIDVEGHGAYALRGASKSVEQTKPVIIASMHSPQEIEGIRDILRPMSYTVEKLSDDNLIQCSWDDCECGCSYVLRC